MKTVEQIRELIVESLLPNPVLGKNYVDYHTENDGECGVTVMLVGDNTLSAKVIRQAVDDYMAETTAKEFDIIIRAK